MTTVLTGSRTRLDAGFAEFSGLLRAAEEHAQHGRFDAAAGYAQAAATCAWFNPAGIFASNELEQLLGRLAGQLRGTEADRQTGTAGRRPASSNPLEVLHVVTQVYQTGGPTQAIACWLEQDLHRRHRVCLTRQGAARLPEKLLDRLASPDDLVRLDTRPGGLGQRAAMLRRLAATADVVVLHSHPYDVVPVIAFAGITDLPPVIYINHGDHVFWVGTSIATALASMRDSGQVLAAERRGVEEARLCVLNRPLRPVGRSMSRPEAKQQLGIPIDQVLVLTAADGAKYRPIAEPSLLQMVLPVFETHPEAMLLAAGPAPDGEWAEAAERTGGRVRALGRLPDISVLHQAADVYLDSFPFSSLTSLLEAGSMGTPGVTYRGHPDECGVLGADTRGVDEFLVRPGDPGTLRRELRRLLTNQPLREALGESTRTAIVNTHTGAGWRSAAAGTYAFAAQQAGSPVVVRPAERRTGPIDVLVELVMSETGYGEGAAGAVRNNLGLLPAQTRAMAALGLLRSGTQPSVRQLIPEWMLPALANGRRAARAQWHRLT